MDPRAGLEGRKFSSPPGFDPGQNGSVIVNNESEGVWRGWGGVDIALILGTASLFFRK